MSASVMRLAILNFVTNQMYYNVVDTYSLPGVPEILAESEELKSSHKEIEALSKSIVTFLGEVHQPTSQALQAKVDNLVQQQTNVKRFIELPANRRNNAAPLLFFV
ncbi:unnamed protein product [Ceratitis capitata]|uniref:(Mediterranean fruit fly) hypothetical protein n=1 Tax=Ceratitis capitata TaxID=7213 RepID=A0A811US91_CERCA|nr:unnamed protein product [Ceratitis capitata]